MPFPRLTAIAVLTAAVASPAAALDSPRKVVDYDIRVTLDPEKRSLSGSETLRWTNPAADRPTFLMFHLYWNAFRNNRSTFFRESGGRLRGDDADKEHGWGSIDVTSMTWEGRDLRNGFRYVSPDDGNSDDRTVLRVDLPRPVEPGETVELSIGWTSKVPRVFARAGYVRDFFMMGQWFPKIAVYEPVGRRRRSVSGWNAHQYHAHSEFYADWGDYRVAVTLPERFVVGSAGIQVADTRSNGWKTIVFEQKGIHDFAWTADPRYIVKEDIFDPARDVPKHELALAARMLGRAENDLLASLRRVKLRFYMQPDHVAQWSRFAAAQKWALAWFGLWAFPYPYAQVSCIDPPEDGLGAGGMEYQTIYTARTTRALGRWPLDKVRFPESVVVHEFGHGYWYGLVASNEFEESWMDEGINSFTEYEMMDRRYGAIVELPFGARFSDLDMAGRLAVATRPEVDPIVASSWGYSTSGAYGHNSYPRPAAVLEQIRRVLGEETFWRGFRRWAERWRFDHPSTDDFLDVMREEASRTPVPLVERPGEAAQIQSLTARGSTPVPAGDSALPGERHARLRRLIDDLIERTFHGTGSIDVRIMAATTEKTEKFTGYDDAGKPTGFEEKIRGKTSKKKERQKGKNKEKESWESVVVVGRTGDIALPAEVVLTFGDGQSWRTNWDGESTWVRYRATSGSRLVKAEVDPGRNVILDRNPWNNARILKGWKGPSAAWKVRTYVMNALQILSSSFWPFV